MGRVRPLRPQREGSGIRTRARDPLSLSALWLCPQIRQALELRLGRPLQQYRDFIDNQMLLLMAQQDRASRIFPHLYLVSRGGGAGALQLGGRRMMLPSLRRAQSGMRRTWRSCREIGRALSPSGLPTLCLPASLGRPQGATWPEAPRPP